MTDSIKTYFRHTRSATYGFLVALPLFVLYEFLIIMVNQDTRSMVRVGADVWIKNVLLSVGAKDHLSIGIVVLCVGVVIFIYDRKKQLKLKMQYFYWMIIESLFYSVFCAFLVTKAVSYIFTHIPGVILFPLQAGAISESSFGLQIALSIGAGLYEELFFRVILVSGLYFIISRLSGTKTRSYFVSAVIAAAIFSGAHYVGSYGDVFTLPSFTFRFLFGLVLNAVYIFRGFGIAAWSHSIYDILVTIAFNN